MKFRTKLLALCACLIAAPACALTQEEIDARWNAMTAEIDAKKAARVQSEPLRRALDAQVMNQSLYELWKKCGDKDADVRLAAAWSVLKTIAPGGDVSRWREVSGFLLPQDIPNALMFIDALYTALIELPSREGGDWLAAEILRSFARSSHGRYDFLRTCPASVADAVAGVAERTRLRGSWRAEALGTLPLARPVGGTVSDSRAVAEEMQFLDAAGLPAANGAYAWDRATGRIYRVISRADREIWVLDD